MQNQTHSKLDASIMVPGLLCIQQPNSASNHEGVTLLWQVHAAAAELSKHTQ